MPEIWHSLTGLSSFDIAGTDLELVVFLVLELSNTVSVLLQVFGTSLLLSGDELSAFCVDP